MILPECDKTHWIPVKALPQKRGASIIQYLPLSLRLSPFGQHICATVGFPPHMLNASLPLLVKEPPAAIQNQIRKLQQDNQPMWSTIWQLEENQSEEEPVAGPCSTPYIRPPLYIPQSSATVFYIRTPQVQGKSPLPCACIYVIEPNPPHPRRPDYQWNCHQC